MPAAPDALLTRIKDPVIRDEIGDSVEPMWGLTLDSYIFSNIGSAKNKEWEGRSLTDLARHQGKRMVDAICDLLIEEDLEVAFVARTGNPDNIRAIARHPAQMVGSDGLMTGDMPNPRTYGTFPYVLGQFVRGREASPAGGRGAQDDLDARAAVGPARPWYTPRRHESRRGSLRSGARQGQRHLRRAQTVPDGISHVLVNGRMVIDNGRHTGALPGRALRSQ